MNYPSLLCLYCIAMTKSDTTIIRVNLSYKLSSFGATVDPTLLQLAICTYLDLYTLHLFSAFSIVAHLLQSRNIMIHANLSQLHESGSITLEALVCMCSTALGGVSR